MTNPFRRYRHKNADAIETASTLPNICALPLVASAKNTEAYKYRNAFVDEAFIGKPKMLANTCCVHAIGVALVWECSECARAIS
jgi:hypothetical protein